MYTRVHLSDEEYNRFIENHPNGDLLQLTDWAESKKLTGWYYRRYALADEFSELRGAATLLFKKIPRINATLCYISRGFVCDYHDNALVEAMLKEAIVIAKEEKAYTIKIDPDLPVDEYEDALENLKTLGFKHHGFQDGMSKETIQSRQTMVAHIDKDDAALLQSFERNNRTKVRNALKKGTEVYKASRGDLHTFVNLMKETGERDGFLTRDITYFESMYDHLNPNGHMELFLVRLNPSKVEDSVKSDLGKLDKENRKAEKKKDGTKKDNQLKDLANRKAKLEGQLEEARRLKGEHPDGIILSGALLALSGHKAYYLYGASSNYYRDYLPNHHMQYAMMQYARDKGAKTYDFGGVSVMPEEDSPHLGLWQFKKIWGTEVSEKIGEFDYILKRGLYTAAEIAMPIFRSGKVKLNQLRRNKQQ